MRLVTLEYDQAIELDKLGFFEWRNALMDALKENSSTSDYIRMTEGVVPGTPTMVEALKFMRDRYDLNVEIQCPDMPDGSYSYAVHIPKKYGSLHTQEGFRAWEEAEWRGLDWCINHLKQKPYNEVKHRTIT